METKEGIVLYPSPPIGHLVSMVELGKVILSQNPSLTVHIILVPPPYQPESTATYLSSVSSSFPAITFHRLPAVTPYSSSTTSRNYHESLILEILCFSNPNVHRTLFSLSQDFNLRALIIDFFCSAVLDITADFSFPVYCFFTSGAACLASFFHLPSIHETTTGKNLRDVQTLDIPGVPLIKGSDMPKVVLERDDEVYDAFIMFCKQLSKSSGIIINTFDALEKRAIKAIREEFCFRNIYPIGPLIIQGRTGDNHGSSSDSCLNWLDSQPEESVVFLCFGSLGLFSEEQVKEIAIGLERSEQRFLWVVRNPPGLEENRKEPDLKSLLPERFLNRTGNRGMVVKSWAPQVSVLNHKAVGGFVTHCGWNSILESVCAGVPMVAWPLYAEQKFNKVMIVEEIKIAIPMIESETGFVSATEVEKRVSEIMEECPVRERVKAMKNAAESALIQTGSSHSALTELLKSWSPKNDT